MYHFGGSPVHGFLYCGGCAQEAIADRRTGELVRLLAPREDIFDALKEIQEVPAPPDGNIEGNEE